MRPNVLLIHPTIREIGTQVLGEHAEVTLAPHGAEATLIAEANRAKADAMIVRVESATRPIFEEVPTLKIVGMHGVGTDTIDIEAATENGVLVINAPLVNFRSTAEHTVALLLAVAKNVFLGDRAVRTGEFNQLRNSTLPMEVDRRSIFVIGLGRIGGEVARKCLHAFDMRVMSYDPAYDAASMAARGVEWVPMEKGLAEADFVTIHVPLKADTRRMIDAAAFARMKKGAIFLNIARGGLVDQAALVAALRSGHLGGAGLDVFDPEPVEPGEDIIDAPNTVLSPHYGGDTLTARNRCSETIARSVLAALTGEPVHGIVNPEVIGRPNFRLGRVVVQAA